MSKTTTRWKKAPKSTSLKGSSSDNSILIPDNSSINARESASKPTIDELSTLSNTKIIDNPLKHDIFSLDAFPSNGPPHKITPTQLYCIFNTYMNTTRTMRQICIDLKAEYSAVYLLINKYQALSDAYQYARRLKGKEYADAQVEMYEKAPNWCYEQDKQGQKRLSQAAVTFLRDKSAVYSRQAAIHDRQSYGDKVVQEHKSVNININTEIPAGSAELAASIEAILNQ